MLHEGARVELPPGLRQFLLRVHDYRPTPSDWLTQRPANNIYLSSSVIQAFITAGVGILVFAVMDSYRQAQTRKVG